MKWCGLRLINDYIATDGTDAEPSKDKFHHERIISVFKNSTDLKMYLASN